MFSLARFRAVLVKEFIQMRRDRLTFGMMIGLPVIQLLLFGYAINSDPRHLPTLLQAQDNGPIVRSIVASLEQSTYFDFQGLVAGEVEGDAALRQGTASFIIVLPPGFERDAVRGRNPAILIAADASDPTAVAGAAAAVSGVLDAAMRANFTGPLAALAARPPAFTAIIHRHYNPEGRTATNIVPGLLAVILSMTMIMITAIAIVREREVGTMEMLIAMPVRPFEVMLGKICPYIFVGYVQTAIFLLAARSLFDVPFEGDPLAFFLGFNLFIVVNLALGFLISTLARNQMQAMQASFFTILPTILLSGFMFPFAGMPGWAQVIGTAVPATHFLRLVRKVMLKGARVADVTADYRALAIILAVVTVLAVRRYRQTLD